MQKQTKILLAKAERGDTKAQFSLGQLYLKRDSNRSKEIGFYWTEKSTKNDVPFAVFTLGELYNEGIGCIKDENIAIELFNRASQNGVYEADYELGKYYESTGATLHATKYYNSAIEGGVLYAGIDLMDMYQYLERYEEEVQTCQRLSKLGLEYAILKLASWYLYGYRNFITQDLQIAEELISSTSIPVKRYLEGDLYVRKAKISYLKSGLFRTNKGTNLKSRVIQRFDSFINYQDPNKINIDFEYYLAESLESTKRIQDPRVQKFMLNKIHELSEIYYKKPIYIGDSITDSWHEKNLLDKLVTPFATFLPYFIILGLFSTYLVVFLYAFENSDFKYLPVETESLANIYDWLQFQISNFRILNESTADAFQYIGFALSTIGISLTIIELRAPLTADRIEAFFEEKLESITSFFSAFLDRYRINYCFILFFGTMISLMSILSVFIAFKINPDSYNQFLYDICSLLYKYPELKLIFFSISFGTNKLWVFLVSTLLSLVFIPKIFSFPTDAIRFLHIFANGKELGMFGLMLAVLGLAGEFYQVLTLIF